MEDFSNWYKPYCDTIEAIKQSDSYWFNYRYIDSYHSLFNIVIGARGDGKTYGFKIKAIKHFLKTGRQALYLRRTEGEYQDSKNKFLADIGDKFYPYKFRIIKDEMQSCEYDEDGEEYVGEWETVIHFAYLANSIKKKSVSYDKVDLMAFDEFIIKETAYTKYLPDEVETFLNFYETVARMRDVSCYFLANAVSVVNPYFFFFDITLPQTKNGIKKVRDDIVIQIAQDKDYKEAKKETRFGKLIGGTDYAKHAIDNEFVMDTNDLIAKKTRDCFYWLTLEVNSVPYAVYIAKDQTKVFISEDINPNYTCILKISDKGKIKKNSLSHGEKMKLAFLYTAMNNDMLYFENLRARHEVGAMLIKWN